MAVISYITLGLCVAAAIGVALIDKATLVRWAGLFTLASAGFSVLKWLYVTFLARNDLSMYRLKSKSGAAGKSWALVTGATDGIGKAFAQELLRRHFHVIIMSRNEEKLKTVREQLTREAGTECDVEYIVADAERATDPKLFEHINARVTSILGETGALRILINNVGIEILEMGLLHEQKPLSDGFDRMLNVNALFPTKLSALLIPYLIPTDAASGKMKGRGKTAIINVSSFSSMIPAPFLTVYGSTKSYNNAFSKNLALELAEFGCDVMTITPSFVASAMTGTDKVNLERCSSRACAAGSLDKLGSGKAVSPYWFHSLQEALSVYVYPTKLVETMVYSVLKGNMKFHKRKRAQKAEEEKKAKGN